MLAGGGAGSMAGNARASLRSSARLSTNTGGGSGGCGGGGTAPAESVARSAEAATAAARRRARAAERALEVEDSPRVLRDKCRLLARALRNAKHLVVYTGAGISTAADIPDYRGPRGVWTRLQRGESVGRVEVSRARPTLTHMALTALWARGTLKFVVSQNCDGLHVRAGLPRRALAELHGDMFAERCAACRRVYLRAFDTTERTARHAHATRRLCHACGAELSDTIVHFGERGRAAWPLNWAGALRHAAAADVVLCLGSSLKVLRRYPRLWRMQCAPRARPALYIVNLQWTPKDAVAALKINARCDEVMALVARRLRLRVPRYRPAADPLLAHAVPLAPAEAHTTRRPLLPAPPCEPPASPPASPSPPPAPSDSPSASDSDEEVPLRRLAERIRAPPVAPSPPPAPPPLLPPPPDLLHAFQVSLVSGEATILLRAQHAVLRSAPAPAPAAGPAPSPSPSPAPALAPRRALSDLRRFRMCRPPRAAPLPALPAPLTNGHAPFVAASGPAPLPPLNGCLRLEPARTDFTLDCWTDVKCKPDDIIKCEVKCEQEYQWKVECDQDSKCAVKCLAEDEAGAGAGARAQAEASALAAAIIARAVLLCRASLYPGLHTILAGTEPAPAAAPPAAAPPPGPARARAALAGGERAVECAWCWRRLGARRCAWYGPPPPAEGAGRAWRRVRGRRYLCACCPERAERADAPAVRDAGGWYGKGYRKGRRPRRPLRR